MVRSNMHRVNGSRVLAASTTFCDDDSLLEQGARITRRLKPAAWCYLLIIAATMGCQNNSSNSEKNIKDVNELGYSEIVDAVITGTGEPVEYHGEQTKTEALADIQLVKTENSCAQNDCGNQFVVKNEGLKVIISHPQD